MHSELRLSTAFRHGGTRVDDRYCTAPFKIMHPFARGAHTDIMVSFVGPGFLKGDEARMDCAFGPGTDTTVRSQSYEKVLDTADGMASRTIDLTARGDARAVFLPFPVIPFRGSAFRNAVTARIGPRTAFAYADVVTNGRSGMGEQWLMRRYDSRVRVIVDDALDGAEPDAPAGAPRRPARLAFAERMLLDPARLRHTGMSMWRDHTHCGMLYLHLPEPDAPAGPAAPADAAARQAVRQARDDELVARIRALAEDRRFPGEFGASRARDGVVVRVLAHRGDDAFDFLQAAASLAVRPA
ncbi:urease accessory protein UreD [Bifidobacterium pullorum subsp. saeculare]|uniref:Urease accessory protein UreD n=1 Tax=Bifidobacterium pullorum subsp. saeculare TaxID=78257 RepID=A0A938WX17_9BIFI|nr:urease accessory protein UreD [Bifidobacterium pullorum]MBM6700450.1 urease accessory protein UreD [Bifidobacterium pullorum subsp. saeculare]